VGKRRTFTPSFKLEVVLDLLSGRKSNAVLCREHQLAPSVISAWKEQFQERAPLVFATEASDEAEQQRVAELERLVGRLTMELEIAKKASSIWGSAQARSGSLSRC